MVRIGIMSPEALSHRWLSLRCWLQRSVLPAALAVIAFVWLIRQFGATDSAVDHAAVLIGFGGLYFALFRGGHILMIRSLHADMMRRFEDAYRAKLARMDAGELRRRNLGFTLARIKRDIMVEAQKKPDLGLDR